MLLRKSLYFFGILFAVMAITSVILAMLEPGSTNSSELGRSVGRMIFPMLAVTALIYFGAKRMGWILKPRA